MGLKVLNCLSHVPNPPNSTSGFPGAEEEVPRASRIECVGLSQGNFRREEWGWVGASKEVGIFKSSRKFPRGSPIYYLPDEGKKPLAEQALLAALPATTLIHVYEGKEGGSKAAPVGGEAVSVDGQRAETTHTLPGRQAEEAGKRWGKSVVTKMKALLNVSGGAS